MIDVKSFLHRLITTHRWAIFLKVALLGLTFGYSCVSASAQHPAEPVDFWWTGFYDREDPHAEPTENGNTGNWNNHWDGNSIYVNPDDEDPTYFPPLPGDTLNIGHWVAGLSHDNYLPPRTVTVDALTLDVSVSFNINANITGGRLDVSEIFISNSSWGGLYPEPVFMGTELVAPEITVQSYNKPITFNGTKFDGLSMWFTGADAYTDNPVGVARTDLVGVDLKAVDLYVGKDWVLSTPFAADSETYVLNVEGSTIDTVRLEVSVNPETEVAGEMRLTDGSEVTIHQYGLVGVDDIEDFDGHANLLVTDESKIHAQDAYLNIGETAKGQMQIEWNSEVRAKTLNVGVWDTGTVEIDKGGKLFTEEAFVGVLGGNEGTVNLGGTAGESVWETEDLTAGLLGTGHVYVHNHGVLKINGEGVLGEHTNQRGVLHLVGPNAKLELGESATFKIGKEGIGELHLTEGATFTSEGTTMLADVDGGTGIVAVDGEDSTWTVNGSLYIGERGTGRVEIRNGGKVTAGGAAIRLGTNEGGDGALLIKDDNSTLDFSGDIYSGYWHKGKVQVDRATVEVQNLTLGFLPDSEGTLEVFNVGSSFKTTGDLTVGREGTGLVNVQNAGKVNTEGNVILAEFPTSGTLEEASAAFVSGNLSEWNIQGDLTVGKRGVGLITVQNKAKLKTDGNVVLGDEGTSTGEVNLETEAQTLWEIDGNLTVGKRGIGAIHLNDGAIEVNGQLVTIGEESDSEGTISVALEGNAGNTLSIAGNFRVGYRGTGTFELSKISEGHLARADVYGKMDVGVEAGGVGTVTIGKHGVLFVHDNFGISVGGVGKGILNVHSGGSLLANTVLIDSVNMGNAVATISGTDPTDSFFKSKLTTRRVTVGDFGYGKLIVSAGASLGKLEEGLHVASGQGSHGILTVTGEDTLVTALGGVTAGAGGVMAEIEVSSQGKIDASEGVSTLGSGAETATVELNINGGQFLTNGLNALNRSSTTISNSGKILLTSNSGKFQLSSEGSFIMGGSAAHPATLTIQGGGQLAANPGATATQFRPGLQGKSIVNVNSGGSVSVHHIEVGSAGQQAVGGTQVTVSGADSFIHASSPNFALVVHPGATLTATAGGRILANGSTTISGTVDVLGGKLIIGKDATTYSEAPEGGVTVLPDGVLYGRGTIKGNLIAKNPTQFPGSVTGARIRMGTSPGLLKVEGDLMLETGTIVEMEIGGLAAGTEYDVLEVTGEANIDGDIHLKFIDGFAPSMGDAFTLLTAGNSDIASNIYVQNLAPGWQYDVSQQGGTWMVTSLNDGVFLPESGDYNDDGLVNAADFVVWRDRLGSATSLPNDETPGVDATDYETWQASFGNFSGTSEGNPAAVPEPSATILLSAWLFALLWQLRSIKAARP